MSQLCVPRRWDRAARVDGGQRYPASAAAVALVIQLPPPGLLEGGGAGTREGRWGDLRGPRGPALLDAEVPRITVARDGKVPRRVLGWGPLGGS